VDGLGLVHAAGRGQPFPPPLLPSSITTHNYHELFARTGMGGNFANSLLVSLGITVGSLLLNTMAGYASPSSTSSAASACSRC
jgi:ABC-type glycerol-3-phosphate transport system permease component